MSKRKRKKTDEFDALKELRTAIEHYAQQRFTVAEKKCRVILARYPDWAQALHILGLTEFRNGQAQSAITTLQRAIEADASYLPTHNDLANIYSHLEDFRSAVGVLRKLDSLQPNDPTTLNNLGVALKEDNQLNEAVKVLQRVLEVDPNHQKALLNLGYTFQKREDYSDAIELFERAYALNSDEPEPLKALARLYRIVGDKPNAIKTYQRWQFLEPDNGIPEHMILALSGGAAPDRAADEYVKKEFDGFAETFEQKLASLDYQAPQLVANLLQQKLPNALGTLHVLDAGCGTGLAGKFLRPLATRLVGVDLSAGMLAKAVLTELYDQLVEAELGTFLVEHQAEFDLITVIDTFVYFGELQGPLRNCYQALKQDGKLAFTVESLGQDLSDAPNQVDDSGGFQLQGSGRYKHDPKYVTSCLTQAGFLTIEIEQVTLRKESNRPVQGLLVWAQKTGSAENS